MGLLEVLRIESEMEVPTAKEENMLRPLRS